MPLMPGLKEDKTERTFQTLKDNKEAIVVVGGVAFLATASILTKKRLLQPSAVARYTAWQAQKGGGQLVAMSVNKNPTLLWSNTFDWSKMTLPKSCVMPLDTLPKLKRLDMSFPYIGHGSSGDYGISADAALDCAHVAVSMDYMSGKQNGLLDFNLARQAYRIENSHFAINQGVGVILNTGVLFGALSVANSMPQAAVVATLGFVAKKALMAAILRRQNAKADDAAILSSSDYALEQQYARAKVDAGGEIHFCQTQEPTFFNRMMYKIGGFFSHHEHAVSRALKFQKAVHQRQEERASALDSGELGVTPRK
jgi:hypothetical protein